MAKLPMRRERLHYYRGFELFRRWSEKPHVDERGKPRWHFVDGKRRLGSTEARAVASVVACAPVRAALGIRLPLDGPLDGPDTALILPAVDCPARVMAYTEVVRSMPAAVKRVHEAIDAWKDAEDRVRPYVLAMLRGGGPE